ncbi:hypothetical protein UDX32_05405 [Serratia marcescens]|uniref:hypothetical protein n=1 Tax=Serratia marcescens TaxID=615 RepID=UPI001186548E|nr:hypothetical protein [Serratia marcescens]CAI2080755.1 Uncharacterised protein [Serratia marcescens]HAT2876975.1 hypothetical protein [Serratia marcescens]HAT2887421.1 hypothetical protein [Serratia marcescens]HAT2893862.1 hypothetical protein [Serratia marcescens]HAT2899654.1 hypothetical protein [Serratia marcescens]
MLKRTRSVYENCIKPELNIYSVGMLFMFAISILLLLFGLLGGAEFVAFVIASAVLAIVIKMLPEISEFSLAGNTVKLKQKLDEAQRLTDELRALKLSTLRTLFQLLLRHPGGFAASYGDGRLPDFINFFEDVKDTEYEKEFIEEMLKYAEVFQAILEQQITNFDTKQAGGENLRTRDMEGIELVKGYLPQVKEIIAHLKNNTLTQ